MAVRPILELGHPLLRERSRSVEDPRSAEIQQTLTDLRDTLRDFRSRHGFGRGISAVQIGVPLRLIYIEMNRHHYAFLNPEVTERSAEKILVWDDCFCFPDLLVRLERWASIEVAYRDERGRPSLLEARDDFSELLQHELDHLDGILAIDRALDKNSFATRAEYERRYRRHRIMAAGA